MYFIKNLFSRSIVVDFFTNIPEVFERAKPEAAKKFFPDWWKELPLEYDENCTNNISVVSTMKRCNGFIDYYKNGVMFPLWSEFVLNLPRKDIVAAQWQFSHSKFKAINHNQKQRGTFLDDREYLHLKFENPWFAQSKKDIDFYLIQPSWNTINDYPDIIIPPGSINLKYQNSININLFFKKDENDKRIRIDQGTPIAHLIPVSESKIDFRYHLVGDDEINKIIKIPLTFTKVYSQDKKFFKQCPFKF